MTRDASMPTSAHRAVICLWISAGLALLMTAAQATGLVKTVGSVGLVTVIGLTTAGLLALMAAKINAGRRWALWLFVIIYAIGSLGFVVQVIVAPAAFRAFPAILQGNAVVQFVLQTAALVLVLTSTSRHWFKSKRATAAT